MIRKRLIFSLALALNVGAASLAAAAPAIPISTDGSDPHAWDMNRDGWISAPANHQIIFENEIIRVSSVKVPKQEAEPFHIHPYYSVLVIDVPYGTGYEQDITGAKANSSLILHSEPPIVNLQPPQALHSIKNEGDVNGHLTRVEFKTGAFPIEVLRPWVAGKAPRSTDGSDPAAWPKAQDAASAAGETNRVIYQDANVRVVSVTVAPGAEEAYHHHAYPAVVIVDKPATTVDRAQAGAAKSDAETKMPHVYLQPATAAHSLRNTDTRPLHLIRVEFLNGFPPGA